MKYKFKENDIIFVFKLTGWYVTERYVGEVGKIIQRRQCNCKKCELEKNYNVYSIKFSDKLIYEFGENYIIKIGEEK